MCLKNDTAAAAANAAVAATAAGPVSIAQAAKAPIVVLVHGAWANGSSWARIVPLLQARGFDVVAVHNPLSSFEADVSATRRVIEDQKRDVVLVGHSYGGAVITEAGNSRKVRALVYVAAFAPSAGQSINSIVGEAPTPPEWQMEIHADAGGVLSWSASGMARYFAPDISPSDAALLAATQAPLAAIAFDGRVTAEAYIHKPSWFVIAENDQIIPPVLQEAFAAKMKAKSVHVPSSHVAMLSRPEAVADVIAEAANAAP